MNILLLLLLLRDQTLLLTNYKKKKNPFIDQSSLDYMPKIENSYSDKKESS